VSLQSGKYDHKTDCAEHEDLQRQLWPAPITLDMKLYGHAEDLKKAEEFMKKMKIPVNLK
jgi:hypothetical protein